MKTLTRALNATRPTAVNLAWAIARMSRKAGEVAELHPDERFEVRLGVPSSFVHRGTARVARLTRGRVLHFHHDHLRSTHLIVDGDGASARTRRLVQRGRRA